MREEGEGKGGGCSAWLRCMPYRLELNTKWLPL